VGTAERTVSALREKSQEEAACGRRRKQARNDGNVKVQPEIEREIKMEEEKE
jgi:hypothetical protein